MDDDITEVRDEVLTVPEAAKFLRCGRNRVYSLVGQNRIPHQRVGGLIRFSRSALMAWLAGSQAAASE